MKRIIAIIVTLSILSGCSTATVAGTGAGALTGVLIGVTSAAAVEVEEENNGYYSEKSSADIGTAVLGGIIIGSIVGLISSAIAAEIAENNTESRIEREQARFNMAVQAASNNNR